MVFPFKNLVLVLVFETTFSFLFQPTSLSYVFSTFQTDIQFSIKTFWFQKFAPRWEWNLQKNVFAMSGNNVFIRDRWKWKGKK